MTADDREYYAKDLNKDVMKAKLKEFKQIEVLCKKFYNTKTI
jgi:hypothetical protein